MEDERLKNYRAIDQLAEEFLNLPIKETSDDELTKRYFHLVNIAEKLGSGSYDHIELIRLFIGLEAKAADLSEPINPKLIKATKEQLNNFYKESMKNNGSKGGKKRSKNHQRNYDVHKEWWDKWQQNKSLFEGVTKYDEAMHDKTGACLKTIFNHRQEFKVKLQ